MRLGTAAMMVVARASPGVPSLQGAVLASLLSAGYSPFAGHGALYLPDQAELTLFGLVNSAAGMARFTRVSKRLPPIGTGLITLLEVSLGPMWVWLAFRETPSYATLTDRATVLASVVAQIVESDISASAGAGAGIVFR